VATMDFEYDFRRFNYGVFFCNFRTFSIPINVITSLFGVPVILMMILKKNRINAKAQKDLLTLCF
jgi:hypothetical protein